MRAVEMEIMSGVFSVRTWLDKGEWKGTRRWVQGQVEIQRKQV